MMQTENTILPALYLIPVPLDADTPLSRILPTENAQIVNQLRCFLVENLRSARRFLRKMNPAFPIDDCQFTVLDEHTRSADVAAMLAPLEAGTAMGVISEAGCPAVADPGADAVAVAQSKGLKVVPLVGPSSILLSLMASGFNGQQFTFHGYLPIAAAERASKIKSMERAVRQHRQTQIFIETPYRNNQMIAELSAELPADMQLCVASDITGENESIITLPLSKWRSRSYNYNKIPTIFLLGN